MVSKIYSEIQRRVEGAALMPFDTLRSTVDGIIVLAEAADDELPRQFFEILGDLDKRFYANGMDQEAEFRRLDEVLGAYEFAMRSSLIGSSSIEVLPYFKLNESDKDRVLVLCASMRKIVLATTSFDQPHKIRLSNRIAAIEAEVNKEKGLFDVILGGVSDLGETLNKFGTNIKPLTDRMNEIKRITRDSTGEYDQLPMPEEVKQLPAPENSDEE